MGRKTPPPAVLASDGVEDFLQKCGPGYEDEDRRGSAGHVSNSLPRGSRC